MRIWYTFAWVLLLLFVTSCNHDELCYHHPHDAKVRVDVDWSKFEEEVPTGMTVMVYPQEGGTDKVVTQHTNTISHAVFAFRPAGIIPLSIIRVLRNSDRFPSGEWTSTKRLRCMPTLPIHIGM